ncbi:MAG: o-succinylbenzoate synthase [Microbacteriaceae bacterium]|nr:o-succinylbenzoate synthase [Microbacteriaceae bacterium]
MRLPTVDELLANVRVVALPMRTRFRGLTVRETMLIAGSTENSWGEFAAFTEYDDAESAPWLACAIEQAWNLGPTEQERPIFREIVLTNATLPAVAKEDVAEILERFGDFRTVKIKVAEPGQTLDDDIARVGAARAFLGDAGRVRIDANGGWTVDEAEHAIRALETFDLEYVEQPCATVAELADLRGRVHRMGILIAADESVRKAADPLAVARAGAADILVVKVAPLGGVRRALDIIDEAGLPVVVSSALESSIGLQASFDLARRIEHLDYDCGLATNILFERDILPELTDLVSFAATPGIVDEKTADELRVSPERERWWRERAARCLALL